MKAVTQHAGMEIDLRIKCGSLARRRTLDGRHLQPLEQWAEGDGTAIPYPTPAQNSNQRKKESMLRVDLQGCKTAYLNFEFFQLTPGSERMVTSTIVTVHGPKVVLDETKVTRYPNAAGGKEVSKDHWDRCPVKIDSQRIEEVTGFTVMGKKNRYGEGDLFDPNKGIKISLTRALRNSKFLSKQDKRDIWSLYFSSIGKKLGNRNPVNHRDDKEKKKTVLYGWYSKKHEELSGSALYSLPGHFGPAV
jgi:hypothetical protein